MRLSRTLSLVFSSLLLSTGPLGASPEDRFFTTDDGVTLHYLEEGTGPALVLVPGWTMAASIWEAQVRAFSGRYRVLALDPRAQGDSEKTARGLTVARRAEDIGELLAHAGAGKAVLVGWSMGGSEALVFAAAHPGALAGLVLVDPSPGWEPSPALAARRRAFEERLVADRTGEARVFTRWMFLKPHPEAFYGAVARESLKTPTSAAVALLKALGDTGAWRPDYARVQIPVLCLTSRDYHSQGLWLKGRMPGLELKERPADGHALFADDPDDFNHTLWTFLERIGYPGNPG